VARLCLMSTLRHTPEHEAFLNKKIEMYDEMALVVGKDMATGQFAKSFDDIEEETVVELDY